MHSIRGFESHTLRQYMLLSLIDSKEHFTKVGDANKTGKPAILRVECSVPTLNQYVKVRFVLPVAYGKSTWDVNRDTLKTKGKKSLGIDEQLQHVEIFDFLTTFSYETTDVVFTERAL